MNLRSWAKKYNISPQALLELKTLFDYNEEITPDTSGFNESKVLNRIRLASNLTSSWLLRNNSGAITYTDNGKKRHVRYGLGNISEKSIMSRKSSDLIGITEIIIAPKDIGTKIGVFTAIETKRAGWAFSSSPAEIAQSNFINSVRCRGGIAGFCQSELDFFNLIRRG